MFNDIKPIPVGTLKLTLAAAATESKSLKGAFFKMILHSIVIEDDVFVVRPIGPVDKFTRGGNMAVIGIHVYKDGLV